MSPSLWLSWNYLSRKDYYATYGLSVTMVTLVIKYEFTSMKIYHIMYRWLCQCIFYQPLYFLTFLNDVFSPIINQNLPEFYLYLDIIEKIYVDQKDLNEHIT